MICHCGLMKSKFAASAVSVEQSKEYNRPGNNRKLDKMTICVFLPTDHQMNVEETLLTTTTSSTTCRAITVMKLKIMKRKLDVPTDAIKVSR